MFIIAILLVLGTNLANGQLNYEGNPFTEYTEYIAEESDLSERTAKQNDAARDFASSDVSSLRPQKLYPIMETEADRQPQQAAETDNFLSDKLQRRAPLSFQISRTTARDISARRLQDLTDQDAVNTAELALNNFLNSKTPEESRVSLDHYLRSQQSPEDQSHSLNAISAPNEQSLVQLDAQPVSQIGQQQVQLSPEMNQVQLSPQMNQVHLSPQMSQGQLVSQANRQQLLSTPTGQAYGYVEQPAVVQPVIRPPTGVLLGQGMLQPVPLMHHTPSFNARNDMIPPAMWRERMRRIRAKPFPYAQPKVAPGFYKGPIAVPMKHKAPVEVIYTKPPGFHRGPAIMSNSPVPYQDASAWFPDSDYPPPQKDVYYSQLYAQSYDPHYYNYIAATGKIRPHLYGKLGKKHQEEQDDGIWSELYRGFKKHGLRNIMTPTFLLGMTLPVVTLMLSALVQKRSIARSDEARQFDQEDALQEYLQRLQRAMECYSGRSSRDAKLDGCFQDASYASE